MKRSVFSTGLRIMEQVRHPRQIAALDPGGRVGLLTRLGRGARYAPRARSPRQVRFPDTGPPRAHAVMPAGGARVSFSRRLLVCGRCSLSRPSGRYVWTRFTLPLWPCTGRCTACSQKEPPPQLIRSTVSGTSPLATDGLWHIKVLVLTRYSGRMAIRSQVEFLSF